MGKIKIKFLRFSLYMGNASSFGMIHRFDTQIKACTNKKEL